MATSYTSLLGLALPVTGELSSTWGDTVNDYITQYLDASIAGTQTISGSQTAVTLSKTTNASLSQAASGATGSSQYQIINCTGNPASLLTITVPAASKAYLVLNNTSTNQSVKVVGTGPTTGVTVAAARCALIAWNGSDFELVASTDVAALQGLGTGVATALAVNIGTAGAFVVNGGALGTPSSGTVTNLTGTASININGTVGATTPTTGAFTTLTTSSTVTLNGGTANGVAYLNGSKVLTTGSALTFDGATFSVGGSYGAATLNGSVGGFGGSIAFKNSGTTYGYIGLNSITGNLSINSGQAGNTGYYITFGVNDGSEQMRLTSTGLGIGTSSPAQKFVVSNSGAAGIEFSPTGGNQSGTYIQAYNRSGAAFVPTEIIASKIGFYTGSSPALSALLDSSGNLGLGVTPSAFSGLTAGRLEVGAIGNSLFSNGSTNFWLTTNTNYETGTGYKYATTGVATMYLQTGGQHQWHQAASGTAGNTISFTQAMTLDASGRLLLGGTTAYSTAKSQLVNGDNSIGANNYAQTSLQYIDGGFSHFIASRHESAGATDGNAITYYLNNSGTAGGSSAPGTGNVLAYFMGGLTHRWYTNGSERARIDSSGNLLVGTTSANGGLFTVNGDMGPATDNARTCANAFYRWSVVYAATGTINTSDAREKTPVRSLNEAEIAAAQQIASEIGSYKWLSAVAEKGDAAREHIGMTVQRAIEIMESNGLTPFNYGFICYDENEETSRYSFRMDELAMFISRGQQAIITDLRARVAALEAA